MLTDADRAAFRELMRSILARLGSDRADANQNANSLLLDPVRINTLMWNLLNHIFPPNSPLQSDFPESALRNKIDAINEFVLAHLSDREELYDLAYDLLDELLYIPENLNAGYNSYGGKRRIRRVRRTRRTRRRRSTRRRH